MKNDSAPVNSIFDVSQRDHVTAGWDSNGTTGRKSARLKAIPGRNGIALDMLIVVLDVLVVAVFVILAMIVHW